ncbi:hypothetical protein C6A87_020280 [Mycobacterium sp. ITM-2016-00317]|uniref:hypothetical protein n=1 Tax=Mycobacterium sp. ITM-2016-00317 TaxID=2099694 RepID=UPI00287F84CA|nr:hypothetical protein [Mycobacterium sp. ITM-2016-00317]WNG86191.1 hypothetical protein C6A87_020280 [Mycobacterium sp. ITM-2016-00317]
MSSQEPRPADAARDDPDPAPRRWRRTQTWLAVGIAAVIAVLGGAAIYAASDNSSPQFPGPPPVHHAGDPADRPGSGRQEGRPLHGQEVVAVSAGGFVTVVTQSGTVTATAPDSITVRSDDGFTQTWSTPAGEGSTFAVGDAVSVRGVQNGMTAELTEVLRR